MDPGPPPALSGRLWRRRQALAGDASQRRYTRLERTAGNGTAILVEYPGEMAALIARDSGVLRWCAERGLRVPAIIDCNLSRGWIVLEDFGAADADECLRRVSGKQRTDLFASTIRPLAVLAAIPPHELPPWNRPLDATRLRFELAGFELWYLRHLRGLAPPPVVSDWLDGLADVVGGHPKRVCHRDYHLNNLFLLADGQVGVIDVQDILLGPDTYDAASLLEERATPELVGPDRSRRWLEEWAATVAAEPGWERRFTQATLQRTLKVLGTFARLVLAGRNQYRPWLEALEHRLAARADEVGLPPALASLLLD